jgi:hypothetical protein
VSTPEPRAGVIRPLLWGYKRTILVGEDVAPSPLQEPPLETAPSAGHDAEAAVRDEHRSSGERGVWPPDSWRLLSALQGCCPQTSVTVRVLSRLGVDVRVLRLVLGLAAG